MTPHDAAIAREIAVARKRAEERARLMEFIKSTRPNTTEEQT